MTCFKQHLILFLLYNVHLPHSLQIQRDHFPQLEPLPMQCPQDLAHNQQFLESIFFAISCVVVDEGSLTCPHCSKVYPIKGSIPNMILRDLGDSLTLSSFLSLRIIPKNMSPHARTSIQQAPLHQILKLQKKLLLILNFYRLYRLYSCFNDSMMMDMFCSIINM